ncbi:hypothetical protein D3C85_1132730 [compost metagenome]
MRATISSPIIGSCTTTALNGLSASAGWVEGKAWWTLARAFGPCTAMIASLPTPAGATSPRRGVIVTPLPVAALRAVIHSMSPSAVLAFTTRRKRSSAKK